MISLSLIMRLISLNSSALTHTMAQDVNNSTEDESLNPACHTLFSNQGIIAVI